MWVSACYIWFLADHIEKKEEKTNNKQLNTVSTSQPIGKKKEKLMRRSTCLRSTNGAKATKSSTVRLPKLRSSNKHSAAKHIDCSNGDGDSDADDRCNQKYISLVWIHSNPATSYCCCCFWQFFFLHFTFLFLVINKTCSRLFRKRMKNDNGFVFCVFLNFNQTKAKRFEWFIAIRFGDRRARHRLLFF